MKRLIGLWTVVLFLCFVSAHANDKHEHNGKLEPYEGEPPQIDISENDQGLLDSGKAVYKKIKLGQSQRGIVIIRVNAAIDTVWSVIRDFKLYPQWIEQIKSIDVYKCMNDLMCVRFTADSGFLGDKNWYVEHDYPSSEDDLSLRNWGTWKLDYNYQSDIDDNVGFWRVIPVTGKYDEVDVIYSTDVRLKGFFMSLFESEFIEKSLKDATRWVKRQSELRAIDTQ